jgi:hypothetical protein
MNATMIREIRYPVPINLARAWHNPDPSRVSPPEYFVLEYWSDHTMRHPTSGRIVDAGVFEQNELDWANWLRGIDGDNLDAD